MYSEMYVNAPGEPLSSFSLEVTALNNKKSSHSKQDYGFLSQANRRKSLDQENRKYGKNMVEAVQTVRLALPPIYM